MRWKQASPPDGMVDVPASKAGVRKDVWVRLPRWAYAIMLPCTFLWEGTTKENTKSLSSKDCAAIDTEAISYIIIKNSVASGVMIAGKSGFVNLL